MKRLAAAASFLAALAAVRPAAAVWPWSDDTPQMFGSLCRVPEMALFSCKIGIKVVSICDQPQGDQAQAGAVYRFGRPGHVELEVTGLHYAQQGFAGGGETQVYADTPTHRYIVFDEIVRTNFGPDGHHDPQADSGLFVQSGGKIVSSHPCTEALTFSQLAEKLIPAGDYVPH
jgi:hypothetical protein